MGSIRGQQVRSTVRLHNTPAPQKVTIGAVAAASNAFGCDEVLIQATTDCYITMGTAPTATTSSHFMPSGAAWVLLVDPSDKISVIQSSAGGTLHISRIG